MGRSLEARSESHPKPHWRCCCSWFAAEGPGKEETWVALEKAAGCLQELNMTPVILKSFLTHLSTNLVVASQIVENDTVASLPKSETGARGVQ